MKTAWSCVVEGTPKFEWQAVNLCVSLVHNAGIAAQDIKVHVTSSVSHEFQEFVLDHGMCLVPIDPFLGDHGYCNKIQQMFSSAFSGHDRVVLCDCDLYFLRPLQLDHLIAPAAGCVVDRPNPPLPLLHGIYDNHGIIASPETGVSFPLVDGERTIASNWNGGLYVFDARHLEDWGRVWARHAENFLTDPTILGRYQMHLDQISWALTLDELSIAFEHLPDGDNYPVHLGETIYRRVPPDISSIHYHDKMDASGQIMPTGVAEEDWQIEAANRCIRKDLSTRIIRDESLYVLFQRWQRFCDASEPDKVDAALAAFQNPRYIRHNARRLEHLASLDLDISDKSVLEFGAGTGDHSLFFLDRGCCVTSIEPRAENVACMARRYEIEGPAFPKGRHRVIRCSVDETTVFLGRARFQIVYNYGLLYHLGNPEAFLRQSAAHCEGLYLLETAVNDLKEAKTSYIEDTSDPTNAIDPTCRLLSREKIFEILRDSLPFVYMPVTQPSHEQFLCDWSIAPQPPVNRHRAIFIGSVTPLANAKLTDRVSMRHVR